MGRHAAWPLLEEAGLAEGVIEVLFTGLDRGVEGGEAQDYERALPIAEAEHALLAWEMNGAPPPSQHGFPLRLVVPGWYGMQNVKWLARITLLSRSPSRATRTPSATASTTPRAWPGSP